MHLNLQVARRHWRLLPYSVAGKCGQIERGLRGHRSQILKGCGRSDTIVPALKRSLAAQARIYGEMLESVPEAFRVAPVSRRVHEDRCSLDSPRISGLGAALPFDANVESQNPYFCR